MEQEFAKELVSGVTQKIDKISTKSDVLAREMKLTVFNLGKEEFGVDINKVTEIIKVANITRVPNADGCIEGVINLRGRIDVVVNLSKKLGISQKPVDDKSRIIIIEAKNNKRGIIVDSVEEVLNVKLSDIQKPQNLMSSTVKDDYLSGVVVLGKRLILMLDMVKILDD